MENAEKTTQQTETQDITGSMEKTQAEASQTEAVQDGIPEADADLGDSLDVESIAAKSDASAEVDGAKVATPTEGSVPHMNGILIKPHHLIIAVAVTVALIVGGFFFGMSLQPAGRDPDIDPNAKDYKDLYVSAGDVEEGSISAPGYSIIHFPKNKTNVQMILPNPKGNPCYFRFVLVLAETGEELYRSGLIPPGMAVTDLTLSRPLDAGFYTMKILIETESLTDRTAMNGVQMEAELIVK